MKRLLLPLSLAFALLALLALAVRPAAAGDPPWDYWFNGTCTGDANTTCELVNRYTVHITWNAPAGNYVAMTQDVVAYTDHSAAATGNDIVIRMWGEAFPRNDWVASCTYPAGASNYNVKLHSNQAVGGYELMDSENNWTSGDLFFKDATYDNVGSIDLIDIRSAARSCPQTSAPARTYDWYVQIYSIDGETLIEWPGTVELYYPYVTADYWSTYQTYSQTTWYGETYAGYTAFRLRPGAPVYPIATLGIEEVGVNQFGYYIDARINAWPDVLSTTVRYEGLQTVNVSPGQQVNANCELGTVGPNVTLGQYHLLLYTEFNGIPINPVPYMEKWPDGSLCILGLEETIGPGAGEVDNQVLAVCQACQAPTTWTNFGRWIVWLECMIQNLFSCWLITWFNGVINQQILALSWGMGAVEAVRLQLNSILGVQILSFDRLVAMGPWAAEPVTDGVSWLGGLFNGLTAWAGSLLEHVADRADALAARLDNLGYIIMSFAGGSRIVYTYTEAGTNFWDVLTAIVGVLDSVIEFLTTLLAGAFDLISGLLRLITDVASLLLMVLTGLIGGFTGSTSGGDMGAIATGLDTVDCTASGVWTSSGPSAGKAMCYFLAGLQQLDIVITRTPLVFMPGIVIGILAIVILLWVVSQFKEIMPT